MDALKFDEINREEEQKVISSMSALLNNYREHLRVKNIEAAAVMLYRVVDEIIHRLRIMGTDIDNERLLAELEDMVCRYLLIGE